MLERTVKDKIKKILKKHHCWYTMPYQAGYSQTGVPDFIVCHRGKFLAVEAKAGNNKATSLQKAQLEGILYAGGDALIINEGSLDFLEEVLQEEE